MEGQSYGVPMVTYSRLCAVELPAGQDLTDYWRSPDSYFLIQGKTALCRTILPFALHVRVLRPRCSSVEAGTS